MMREAASKPVAPFQKMLLNRKLVWQKRYNALQCLRLMPSEPVKQLVQRAWQQEKNEMRVKQLAEELLFEWKLRRPEPAAAAGAAKDIQAPDGPSWRNPFELEAEYIRIPGGKYRFSVTQQEVTGRSFISPNTRLPTSSIGVSLLTCAKKKAWQKHCSFYRGNALLKISSPVGLKR